MNIHGNVIYHLAIQSHAVEVGFIGTRDSFNLENSAARIEFFVFIPMAVKIGNEKTGGGVDR